MQAAILDAFGPSTGLRVGNLTRPAIGDNQLLVKVTAAGVNPIDWKIGLGLMAARYGDRFPMVLGFDASGTVAEVGNGVRGFQPGDAVFARSDVVGTRPRFDADSELQTTFFIERDCD